MLPQNALIIEDNRSVGDILSRVFKMQGVASHVVNNGQAALEALETTYPSIILLDMGLTDLNGNSLLDYIVEQKHLAQSVVIILSNNRALSRIGLERIDFILRKPLDIQKLTYIVRQIAPQENTLLRNWG